MKSRFIIVCLISCTMPVLALDELGRLDVARKEHPAVFVPGNVLEYTIGNVKGYIYNGVAEKCFEGDMAENDSELFREATLDAKRNLHVFLAKGDKTLTVSMHGARTVYAYSEGEMRHVIMFVPQKNVEVSNRKHSDWQTGAAPLELEVPVFPRSTADRLLDGKAKESMMIR